ncbi:MAG TPA: family 1 encapsulin nanocompartment shell protein [Anaerolineae bacterium]|nr:family 1 encapsulin nanocompartment shell protein [Anaerolineae bacterium]HPL29640.1 family 1 encapsulin nanocompartment shell protein [Anaerolineae bacterium]
MSDYLLRSQAPLTAEEWQALDQAVVQVARRTLVARRFLTIFGPLGAGVQHLNADRYLATQAARISAFGAEGEDILFPESRRCVPLPILYRDFRLSWRDLETSRRLGMPLDTTAAAIAATHVATLEDRTILNGNDEQQQVGFLNFADRLRVPLGHWDQPGGPFAAILSAVTELVGHSMREPFTVVVPPPLFVRLNRVFDNTGVLEIDQVRRLVGGEVYMSPTLPPGVAVVVAPGTENMDLAVAQDIVTAFLETEAMEHNLRVLEIASLRIKRPGAVCTLGQV